VDGGANVPLLRRADADRLEMWKSFVPGRTVRDYLVAEGAKILSSDTDSEPELGALDGRFRLEAIWRRGSEMLGAALPSGFLDALQLQLDRVHSAGVTGFSLTFGNVVVHYETGEPWFIDFDAARVHRSKETLSFRRDRDRDRELFNAIYGAEIMTEARAQEVLRSLPSGYAPIDLGGGLVTRGFWSVDSGTGRWDVLNGKALEGLIEGKRILDLGSNNGVMPLMMLRAGARRVVGIEQSPELVAASRKLHRVFEWRDMKAFDFSVCERNMLTILDGDWEHFDVVTAFASLYYLCEKDMYRIAEHVRKRSALFVVQAKTDTRRVTGNAKAKKSSPEYFERLLMEAGFGVVKKVQRDASFTRPLLIAS
jgi:tRNA A-37 threonylcarbamoyl transferase component Bud32